MKARIPISASERQAISRAAVAYTKQHQTVVIQRMVYAAMLAANKTFKAGPVRAERFKRDLLAILEEATDMYDDVMETGLERACRERGLDTAL